MNQKLINSKEKEKNKYVANAIVAGALASHFVGKVSKEILDAASSIFTDIPKDDAIDQQQEYSNLKKEKKQNHKYDSVMDATPAPASSIAPRPFKVIPIAAKVCTNSL